jgi:hypothetical protein
MQPVHKFLIRIFAICVMAFLPLMSFATETEPKVFQPEISIPGLQNLPDDSSLMARYIRAVYIFFVWIVGLLAVVMIIYGGIRWISAAGNTGHIKEARDIVTNAIAGVVLALLSVVILRTINPDLTQLKTLALKQVAPITEIGEYTKYPDFAVCAGDFNHVCGTIYDQKFNDGTTSSCYGTYCKIEKGVRSICQIPYNTTSKQYEVPTCVTSITTIYPKNEGSFPLKTPVTDAQENDKILQGWTGVIMSKNGLGTDYTVNRCYQSAIPMGFILGNPAQLIPATTTASLNSINGHSRASYRGCADRDETKMMSELLFKP